MKVYIVFAYTDNERYVEAVLPNEEMAKCYKEKFSSESHPMSIEWYKVLEEF